MLVADLHHFLDLDEDVPAPARRLAAHLAAIVRAATSGDANASWVSAVPCRRRRGNRACPGRMIVLRPEPSAAIGWQCNACDEEGSIGNWADSRYDLRRRTPVLVKPRSEILVSAEVAAALRDLQLLDADLERVVYAMRGAAEGVVLAATDAELDELLGAVAAEANHETNRRRQRRLEAALDALVGAGGG